MNRHAIALAADSAATVTEWVEGRPRTRHFDGGNKILQLSDHHPVGMMIYSTAALQEVPWELLVKDFRENFGDKSFKRPKRDREQERRASCWRRRQSDSANRQIMMAGYPGPTL